MDPIGHHQPISVCDASLGCAALSLAQAQGRVLGGKSMLGPFVYANLLTPSVVQSACSTPAQPGSVSDKIVDMAMGYL